MSGDPSLYWSPAPQKTVQLRVARRLMHFFTRLIFAAIAVVFAQFIAGKQTPDANAMWIMYGIGIFITQWMSAWFLDLATADKLGTTPGIKTSKIIYFFALALRSMPHAIFLAWLNALFSQDGVFPDPAQITFYEIALPLLSLRKLSFPPFIIMPGNIRLIIDRDSELYQGIIERIRPANWLENVKFVRLKTQISTREALFLINLVHQDQKSRTTTL
ncbi:MAG: hypothetical protein ACKVQS_14605 [Fimbriimonadaceae bacterium]